MFNPITIYLLQFIFCKFIFLLLLISFVTFFYIIICLIFFPFTFYVFYPVSVRTINIVIPPPCFFFPKHFLLLDLLFTVKI